MHTETLQQLGLPKNEAKIYEALLELGQANVSIIANKAKVNRRNVYDSLKNLIKRRLVMRIMGQREQLYGAQSPEKLKDILVQEHEAISSILPDLKAMYKSTVPEEQIFISRGKEGVKNFWNYLLSQNEAEYFVGGKGGWHDPMIDEERKRIFETALKKKIHIQGIFDYEVSQNGKDIYSQYDGKHIRFFPKGYSTKATYDICGDRVVLLEMPKERSVENVTIFTIVSRSLADSYRTWFQFLWEYAKPIKNL